MRLEFPAAHGQRDIAEFLVFKEEPEVVRQPTLWNFELYGVALPGYVHAVSHHAHLQHAASLGILSHSRDERLANKDVTNIEYVTYKGIYLTEYREFVVG